MRSVWKRRVEKKRCETVRSVWKRRVEKKKGETVRVCGRVAETC